MLCFGALCLSTICFLGLEVSWFLSVPQKLSTFIGKSLHFCRNAHANVSRWRTHVTVPHLNTAVVFSSSSSLRPTTCLQMLLHAGMYCCHSLSGTHTVCRKHFLILFNVKCSNKYIDVFDLIVFYICAIFQLCFFFSARLHSAVFKRAYLDPEGQYNRQHNSLIM